MARWAATERLELNAMYLRQNSETFDLGVSDNTEGRLESNNRPGPSNSVVDFSLLNLDTRVPRRSCRQWRGAAGRA